MARATQARIVAASVLAQVRRREARARDVLRSSDQVSALDARDRAFVSRLVLGTVGASGLVEGVVRSHAKGGIEPRVFDALCLGAFELMFLSTPPSVAVSQGVELARRARPRAAGLANAVLRRIAERDAPARREALARVGEGSASSDDLRLVSGYPSWLVERVAADRGDATARDLALSALQPAPVYVSANVRLRTDAQTRSLLEEAGLEPVATGLPGSFVLRRPAGLASSGLVETTEAVVADLSAQGVAYAAGVRPGMRVLEVGQGRGTKSILLQGSALRAGGLAHVVGVDSEPFKTRVATRRMEHAGLGKEVSCLTFDGCDLGRPDLPVELAGRFDLVFVDAPCSGTGTMRRHPEIAWGLAPESVDRHDPDGLPSLQERLLVASSRRVAAGGVLCYATCSILRAEDEDVVEAFLASEEGSEFSRAGEDFLRKPAEDGPDGHYCARLVRRDA